MKTLIPFSAILIVLFTYGCESPNSEESVKIDPLYVLPFPVGREYSCSQGFNSSPSHVGTFTYAVDFSMAIGTVVTAGRNGRIVFIVDSYSDNDQLQGHENVVILMHEDSTYSRYAHLTINGARVTLNQRIMPGDTVGLSGSSGTNGEPHLHFDVTNTFNGRSDQTIPFDFKNIDQHPIGLQRGTIYKALSY